MTQPQVDTFLRDNLEWMGRASNWAKFTATASIGVVHRGHVKESMNLLQPYLPQGGVSTLPYSEGGALYALGLIHSSKGSDGNAEVSCMSVPIVCYVHVASNVSLVDSLPLAEFIWIVAMRPCHRRSTRFIQSCLYCFQIHRSY